MTDHPSTRRLAIAGLLALVALTLLLATAGAAQAAIPTANPAWTWLNPLPHGEGLDSVCFTPAGDAWSTGLTRGFLSSTDGGATWSATRTGPPLGFLGVEFADNDHGWAVGESSDAYGMTGNGIIYRSTDGGTTWTSVHDPVPGMPLGGVDFLGVNNGWAVGRFGTVLCTGDGGDTWSQQDTPDEAAAYDFTGVSFTSTSTGWAFGDESDMAGMVLATADGGTTWTVAHTEANTPLWNGDAWGTQTAWAVGADLSVVFTTDGGATWADGVTPAAIGFEDIMDVDFGSATQGVACTKAGRIIRTTDGGANWAVVFAAGDGTQLNAIGLDGATGLALGEDGLTVRSTDSGATWTDVSSGSRAVIAHADFVSANLGWVCGGTGTVLHTSDGGTTWTAQASGTTRNLIGLDFVSATRGWITGAHGLIRRTTNGGTTWSSQRSGTTGGIGDIDFSSASRGWACGAEGLLLRTTDGGRTWTRRSAGTKADLFSVQFIDRTHGWICGSNGVVARTTNAGRTWSRTHVRVLNWPGATLFSMSFVNRSEGWVCGVTAAGSDALGTVAHTTDGGRTWVLQGPTKQKTVAEMDLNGIEFTDANNGLVVGDYGFLMWTTDGGAHWKEGIRPTPDEYLVDVEMVSPTVGYAVGTGGTIIKTTSGGR